MCILIASTAHPDYPLLILSNRDEFYDRATQEAQFWTPKEQHCENGSSARVLAPLDMARDEHGTWIGISTSGRLAVLLNCHEDSREQAISKISRGLFPKEFLTSDLPTQEWISHTVESYGAQGLAQAGGFTMFCGVLDPEHPDRIKLGNNIREKLRQPYSSNSGGVSPGTVCAGVGPFSLFSNRTDDTVCVLDEAKQYLCVSNGMNDDSWVKTEIGESLLQNAVRDSLADDWDQSTLIEYLFAILSTDTYPHAEPSVYNLRKSVFIPRIDIGKDAYGTRTQTVILVDHDFHVTYLERNLGDPKTLRHEFTIGDKEN